MEFKGAARPLSANDFAIVAGYLRVEIAALRAVVAVEAAGKGFDAQGRPKMLFEPHIFWRQLPQNLRNEAQMTGLAYPKWKPGAYPKESYTRIALAMKIDAVAALKSASWGLGQLMGFNHAVCGFDTVQAMVEAMKASEGAQLMAMGKFIDGSKLTIALRDKNWAAFAKGYNGDGYKANRYDVKLSQAYAKRPVGERVVPPMPSQDDYGVLMGRVKPKVEIAPPLNEPVAPQSKGNVIDKPASVERVELKPRGETPQKPLVKMPPPPAQPIKAGPIAAIVATIVAAGAAVNVYWCDYIGLFCN